MTRFLYIAISLILVSSYCNAQKRNPSEFISEGYMLFEQHFGDMNNDGEEDCVLIVKATNTTNVVTNRFDEVVDRNRRGILILFKKEEGYTLATENYDCFMSENEDGGVYFPPELSVAIEKGNLYINYAHGRYGYWKYTFRFQKSDFELIGYDATNTYGPVINEEKSINFLTKKKLTRENTNEDAEGNDEVFKETWTKIEIPKLLKLSAIKDFEELDMSMY